MAPPTLQHYVAAPDPKGTPQLLGSSVIGSVYLYTDTKTNSCAVAIKRVRLTHLTESRVKQLAHELPRELRIRHALRHPHIIQLKDVFLDDTHLNLVMEFADRGPLLTHVHANMMLPCTTCKCKTAHASEDTARRWLQQLMVTLDYLHAKGVAGSEIKLEDSLIKSVDRVQPPYNLALKVADFGLSKRCRSGPTLVATAPFTAPEVLAAHSGAATSSRPYDAAKADVWAAGVLLHLMVVGQHPFLRFGVKLPEAECLQRMTERPLQLPEHLSEECKDILEAMLHPNPANRISVQGIKRNTWFMQGLPPAAADMAASWLKMPSACSKTQEQLEQIIEELVQRLQRGSHLQTVASQ